MNRRTRPSIGCALRAAGNEIAKRIDPASPLPAPKGAAQASVTAMTNPTSIFAGIRPLLRLTIVSPVPVPGLLRPLALWVLTVEDSERFTRQRPLVVVTAVPPPALDDERERFGGGRIGRPGTRPLDGLRRQVAASRADRAQRLPLALGSVTVRIAHER